MSYMYGILAVLGWVWAGVVLIAAIAWVCMKKPKNHEKQS